MGGKCQLTWTAKRFKRINRSYKQRRQINVGHFITLSSRVYTVTPNKIKIDIRTLYQVAANNIFKRDADFDIGSRSRDIVNCTGVRIIVCFTNANVDRVLTDYAVYGVNVALLAPRDTSIGNVGANNFFRGDNNVDRFYGFNIIRSFFELHNSPINSDDYDVLYCEKRLIAGYFQLECWNFQKYIKVNRQLRFIEFDEPHEKLILVYWVDDTRLVGGDPAKTVMLHT